MNDETEHLSKTLAFTLSVIIDSDAEKRRRIALAYQEAELLVAAIPLDNGDARARIEACVKRFDRYKAVGDVACAGSMLKAVQERVEERNLRGWRKLRKAIDQASKLLPLSTPTRHSGAAGDLGAGRHHFATALPNLLSTNADSIAF